MFLTSYQTPTKRTASVIIKASAPDGTADYYTDGINDNVEIQSALTFLATLGGGTIYFRKGTYLIQSSVSLNAVMSAIEITGEQGAVIKNQNTGAVNFLIGGNNVSIHNLEFWGITILGGQIGFFDVKDNDFIVSPQDVSCKLYLLTPNSGGHADISNNTFESLFTAINNANVINIQDIQNVSINNNKIQSNNDIFKFSFLDVTIHGNETKHNTFIKGNVIRNLTLDTMFQGYEIISDNQITTVSILNPFTAAANISQYIFENNYITTFTSGDVKQIIMNDNTIAAFTNPPPFGNIIMNDNIDFNGLYWQNTTTTPPTVLVSPNDEWILKADDSGVLFSDNNIITINSPSFNWKITVDDLGVISAVNNGAVVAGLSPVIINSATKKWNMVIDDSGVITLVQL